MKIGAKSRNALAALIIVASLSVLTGSAYLLGLFDYLENKLYDLRVNLFAHSAPISDEIIVVLLDQKSIDWAQSERDWKWPWPRKSYADFVEYMKASGAKSVAFDMLFTEPSVYRNSRQDEIISEAVEHLGNAQSLMSSGQIRDAGSFFRGIVGALRELRAYEDDDSFVRAEEDFGRVVQGVFFSFNSGNAQSWPEELDAPLFELSGFDPIMEKLRALSGTGDGGEILAQLPIEGLRNAAGAVGSVTGWADFDGIIRRSNLFTLFDGKAVPGIAPASLMVGGLDNKLSYDPAKRAVIWGAYTIPVDKNGRSILRYRGRLDRHIPYFMDQVLQSAESYARGEEPLLPPETFQDKYVFFGLYAPGLYDIFANPIINTYPGVGVHVTLLDNILQGDLIRESPVWINLVLIAVVIIIAGVLGLYPGKITVAVTGTLLTFLAVTALGLTAYGQFNVWLPMMAPYAGIILAFLTSTLYSYATEGSQKRFIKSAFSRYLSPQVIEQIIADPSKLNLGGEKREMTAIFTDIQRFSSISEALQKEYAEEGTKVLVNLLNLYLTEMSNIVLANGGTIDKYEGDAIIAFFGAPIWTESHAALACRSAIQMKKREKELVQDIMNPGGPFYTPLNKLIEKGVIRKERPLYTRLGVNTGDMVVGNMGTPGKMDYTIMGNAVNLSARLEGVNKQYDTRGILISEYTRDKIGEEFILRGLSRVRVVGINTPLRLYELLEERSAASEELLEMTGAWEKAFIAYENQEFLAAKNTFASILQKDETDSVARLYLDRCCRFIANPPAAEKWNEGIDDLTEK
jgi:adenylate cyclase